jgi:serine/threonine-protein kinase
VLWGEAREGGYGVVYRAHLQGADSGPIALKLIPTRGNIDRLLQEPMLLSKLRNPSVVGVQDYFIHQGQLVIALEYIPGGDLRAHLAKNGPFSSVEVRELLFQLGGALAEAHSKGIIHRDIKPANIMLDVSTGKRRFVLTDFGIGREGGGLLIRKLAGGTLPYMSPEQLRGRPVVQSDLWALGVVAYQALTGKFPFTGETRQELTRSVYYDTPTAPSQLTVALELPDRPRQPTLFDAA